MGGWLVGNSRRKELSTHQPFFHKTMWQQRRKNKYNAKSQIYNGRAYRSKLEAGEAYELDMLKKAKEIKDWEYEKESIDLKVYGQKVARYRPDFWVYHNDGSLEIIETKGFWTPEAKIKWALLEAIYSKEHPEIRLTVIK